jgi:hypothetical protein
MDNSLPHRIAEQVSVAAGLYHRLILVAGPPRAGKTTALRNLAEERSWPLVNVNLSLSEQMLELTSKQRALKLGRLLDQVAKQHEGEVVILDNTEILFSPELQQDPLRLLQRLSRNRTVIVAWAGQLEGENLNYANPSHPEFKRYNKPDAVIVSALDARGEAGEKENKKQA